jgi:hypothetical protein
VPIRRRPDRRSAGIVSARLNPLALRGVVLPETGTAQIEMESGPDTAPRLNQSLEQFEVAFEQEMAAERRRRKQLRQRAANRSRARRIARTESHGKVRFSVLFLALSLTVVAVVVVMFETLAWLMG